MKPIAARAVLDALDAAAARGDFPAFDNMNVDYISSRLAVYRGESDWAVVFNSIAWMDQSLTTIVEPIGDGVAFTRTSEIAQNAWTEDPAFRRLQERMEALQDQGFLRAFFNAFRLTRQGNEWVRTRGDELLADAERAREAAMAAGVTDDHKFLRMTLAARRRDPYRRRVDVRDLPGGELVAAGLADLERHTESVAALLVSIGRPRLRRLGYEVPDLFDEPERRLYALLAREDAASAHGRYNALIRRLVSFERAAESVR